MYPRPGGTSGSDVDVPIILEELVLREGPGHRGSVPMLTLHRY